MEEKKRRPRITKGESDAPLKEQEQNDHNENQTSEQPSFERWSQPRSENQPPPYERRRPPYDNDRPAYNRDRNESERSYNNDRAYNSGRNDHQQGGGGYNRPYNNDRPAYNRGGDRNEGGGGGYNRPYNNDRPAYNRGGDRNEGGGGGYNRPYNNDRPAYNRDRNEGGGGGYNRPNNNDRPAYNRDRNEGGGGGYNRPYNNDRPAYNRGGDRNEGGGGGYNRPYNNDRPAYNRGGDRNEGGGGGYNRPYNNDRPAYNRDRNEGGGGGGFRKPFNRGGGGFGKKPFRKNNDYYVERKPKPEMPTGEGMPLNKYLAHCGISSRRKAVEYIEEGKVTVNGIGKAEPFYRVQAGDVVVCDGKLLTVQERMVYVLLNKPKNVITTSDDERGRTTVLDIVDSSFSERLFPVGRLDRDTTGLIMLTNDGDLAHKLTHPSFNIQKQYRVGLRSSLKQADLEAIEKGVELEDGVLEVNWIRFSEDHPERDMVELEISNGRNRVVRRLFEHLGYEVYKLDRFYFAGLTKKELARGAFRELTQREVMMLRHFTGHPSTAKKKKKKYYDDNGNAEEVNPTADDESDDIEIDDIEMEGEDNITDDKD